MAPIAFVCMKMGESRKTQWWMRRELRIDEKNSQNELRSEFMQIVNTHLAICWSYFYFYFCCESSSFLCRTFKLFHELNSEHVLLAVNKTKRIKKVTELKRWSSRNYVRSVNSRVTHVLTPDHKLNWTIDACQDKNLPKNPNICLFRVTQVILWKCMCVVSFLVFLPESQLSCAP